MKKILSTLLVLAVCAPVFAAPKQQEPLTWRPQLEVGGYRFVLDKNNSTNKSALYVPAKNYSGLFLLQILLDNRNAKSTLPVIATGTCHTSLPFSIMHRDSSNTNAFAVKMPKREGIPQGELTLQWESSAVNVPYNTFMRLCEVTSNLISEQNTKQSLAQQARAQ